MTDYLRDQKMESLKAFLNNRSEPAPCPFCGSSDIFINDVSETQWCVICRECRARTANQSSESKALNAWNHRGKPRY